MTSAERERAVSYLEQTKAALLDSTRDLPASDWLHKPSPEAWNAAECVEHLRITEESLCGALREMAAQPAAPEDQLALAAGKEELIVKAVPSRGRKVKGPPGSLPDIQSQDPLEILARFIAVRDGTIEYARTTADPLRTRLHAHFVFGELDGYQWLIFMAAHSERHRRQIEEVKSVIASS